MAETNVKSTVNSKTGDHVEITTTHGLNPWYTLYVNGTEKHTSHDLSYIEKKFELWSEN